MLQKALKGQKNYDLIFIRLLSKIDQDEEPKKIGKVTYRSNNVVENDFLVSKYSESSTLLRIFRQISSSFYNNFYYVYRALSGQNMVDTQADTLFLKFEIDNPEELQLVKEQTKIVIEFWKFILNDEGEKEMELSDRLKVDIGRLIEGKKANTF